MAHVKSNWPCEAEYHGMTSAEAEEMMHNPEFHRRCGEANSRIAMEMADEAGLQGVSVKITTGGPDPASIVHS